MRPLIGLTCKTSTKVWNFLQDEYMRAIEEVGGLPLLIPCLKSTQAIEEVAQRIDGLVLSGGKDLDPIWYNEEPTEVRALDPRKDFLDMNISKFALQRNIPILGICRGIQVLNVVAGGTLNQTLHDGLRHWQKAPTDYPTHEIEIKPETLFSRIIGKDKIRVNTFHHQSVRKVAPGFKVSALAQDGVIEAIESNTHRFVLALQFHAEYLWEKDPLFKNLFSFFVKECQKEKQLNIEH
jgi:putative glutamine amidotransferase